jgi:hypothetical protein
MSRHINCKHKSQEVSPEILPNNPEILPNTLETSVNNDGCSDKKKCVNCYKLLASQKTLQEHIKLCKGISNPFECHKCHIILANSGSKSRHMKTCRVSDVVKEPLEKYIKNAIPQSVRITVWDTYIGLSIGQTKCTVCNTNTITQFSFHCGHVIAEKKGGTCDINNLRPICKSCNSSMKTMNLDEYKERYFKS